METGETIAALKKSLGRWGLGAAAGLALLGAGGRAFADPPYAMAPPVQPSYSDAGYAQTDGVVSQDTVFGWQDVPQDQRVPIRRAVFDRGGYQLYDTAGETIVVPFTNQNLYVMKFALSDDGTTYFLNAGDAPVLYVPRNAYLENAAVPGSRWYPFPKEFHPSEPVFLGIAPSWGDFCSMGWYPDMAYYGGYWGHDAFVYGGYYRPTFGLTIIIGGSHYDGWDHYRRYYDYHPAPYHVTIVNRNVYNYYNDRHNGYGGGRDYAPFRGTGHPYYANRPGHDGGDRAFMGTGHPYYAHRDITGDRDFRGLHSTEPVNGRTFGGGERSGARPLGGNDRVNADSVHPHTFQGARPDFGGERHNDAVTRPTLDNGRPNAGHDRTFEGAGRPSFDDRANRPAVDSGSSRPAFHGGDSRPAYDPGQSRPQYRSDTRPVFSGGRSESRSSDTRQSSDRGGSHQSGGKNDNRDNRR